MGVEKINPVEKTWNLRDSKSKRPAREEMVPADKKKQSTKKEEANNQKENINRRVLGRNPGVMAMEQAASEIYARMKQQELKRQLEEREEKEKQESREER